jgi:hypothetical protein
MFVFVEARFFNARWPAKTMQDRRAEIMQDGRANKCKVVEQKLFFKMQDDRAKVKLKKQEIAIGQQARGT